MKNFICIVLLLLLYSCKSEKETIVFQNYLNKTHSEKLENKIYAIIPLNLCGSCVKEITRILNSNTNKDTVIVIIADYTSVNFEQTKKKFNGLLVLGDNKMTIMKEKIVAADKIELIKIKNNLIVDKIKYDVGYNEKEILFFLKN